jgi:arsenite-transporting ATPase
MHRVPLFPDEVRGIDSLRRFGELVWSDADSVPVLSPVRSRAQETAVNGSAPGSTEASTTWKVDERRLLIFGGKGGVGKTTSAAATALALAKGRSSDRVLVFSTDPAHSLSDSFDEKIGESKRGVAGLKNLDAMEIDPSAQFEELKNRYRAWTDEMFASLGGSRWEVQFDREAMRDLVALAPPGIDEIAALSAISDLLDQNRYATIVLDTAPTGHLIRFLELPEVALSWVHTFIRLLLKYQNIVRSSGVAEELIALSKNIKRVISLLTDRAACEFIGVAIPERMSLEETARLVQVLKRLKVPIKRVLINGILPADASACDFCRSRRRSQQIMLENFPSTFAKEITLLTAPQQPHDIRGPKRLQEHFSAWQRLKLEPRAETRPKKRDSHRTRSTSSSKSGAGVGKA